VQLAFLGLHLAGTGGSLRASLGLGGGGLAFYLGLVLPGAGFEFTLPAAGLLGDFAAAAAGLALDFTGFRTRQAKHPVEYGLLDGGNGIIHEAALHNGLRGGVRLWARLGRVCRGGLWVTLCLCSRGGLCTQHDALQVLVALTRAQAGSHTRALPLRDITVVEPGGLLFFTPAGFEHQSFQQGGLRQVSLRAGRLGGGRFAGGAVFGLGRSRLFHPTLSSSVTGAAMRISSSPTRRPIFCSSRRVLCSSWAMPTRLPSAAAR
jgi:hypothetical protein